MNHLPDIKPVTNSDEDFAHVCHLWQTCFPDWPIAQKRLYKILYLVPNGRHYIHAQGFCFSLLEDGVHGRLAAVGVLPDFRNRGLGSALVNHALDGLKASAKRELKSFEIGSTTPRFWPQMPASLPQYVRDWVRNRGMLCCERNVLRK